MSVADSLHHTPTVLVTGGAKRLGRAFCLAFAKAGWHVICHYNTSKTDAEETQQLVTAMGVSCNLVQGDLSLPNAHLQLLKDCLSQAHCLPDCIVNNASIFEEDTASTSTAVQMQTHFQTNTVLPLLLGNATLASNNNPQHAKTKPSTHLDNLTYQRNPAGRGWGIDGVSVMAGYGSGNLNYHRQSRLQ